MTSDLDSMPETDHDWHSPELPDSLTKALYDPHEYVLKLRTGDVIWFCMARMRSPQSAYVTLYTNSETRGENQNFRPDIGVAALRGLDVRIADIVWCADAHHSGSNLFDR